LVFSSLWWKHNGVLKIGKKIGKDGPKYAFATLLAGVPGQDEEENWRYDKYFIATRILTFQLLHNRGTRSRSNIPFIVGVNQNYSEAKQERLRKDGATVVEIEPIYSDWIKPPQENYVVVLTKLRFWEFEEYDRICIIDGDGALTRPLDGVFDDPAVALQTTRQNKKLGVFKEDEGPIPPQYAFAAPPETAPRHKWPPTPENGAFARVNYLNAGFMVLRPDKRLFNHYMRILSIPNRFDPQFPEQNLLNYAHRKDGNMPWMRVQNTWNVNFPTIADIKGGVALIHEKYWAPTHKEVGDYLKAWRYLMEGYFAAKDEFEESKK
jgi:alpha-N-acetylglucosamine transferase